MARTVQPWKSIDKPDPVGKTPITTWPFRIDSKHFTRRGLKLSDGKLPLLREKPTRRSTDKNCCLPAIFDVLFIVCDRTLIKYNLKFWVFGGRCQGLFPPHPQSQGKAPWGRGCTRSGVTKYAVSKMSAFVWKRTKYLLRNPYKTFKAILTIPYGADIKNGWNFDPVGTHRFFTERQTLGVQPFYIKNTLVYTFFCRKVPISYVFHWEVNSPTPL